MADIRVEFHGSVTLLRPTSEAGTAWIKENVQAEGWQWMGKALACEPRMAPDVVEGARENGLTVDFGGF